MTDTLTFSVKAKGEFAHLFREAFEKMGAIYIEEALDNNEEVICFSVRCRRDKVDILSRDVPLSAYASVGFNSS